MRDEEEKKEYRTVDSPGLGSGLAEYARQLFLGRRKKIDEAVDEMSKGNKPKKG